MAQTVKITPNPTRQAALARRQAMSKGGKAAIGKPASVAASAPVAPVRVAASNGAAVASPSGNARSASLARRQALAAFGKTGVKHHDRVRTRKTGGQTAAPLAMSVEMSAEISAAMPAASNVDLAPQPAAAPTLRRLASAPVRRVNSPANTTRALVLARRKAMANGGKAAIPSASSSAAQTMRAANPQMSSRDLAKALRNQNNRTGKAGKTTAPPTGRVRPSPAAVNTAATADPANVEISAKKPAMTIGKPNLSALTITGTNPGRSQKTTGNDAGTCRSVTGTEYMAAEIFDQFCQSGASTGMAKPMSTSTISLITRSGQARSSNAVTGAEIQPSSKMTGTEAGAARNLTGMQYSATGPSQTHGRSASTPTREPRKPLISHDTPRNNGVTGALTAQGGNVTGDEPGKCSNISGDFYIGGNGRAAIAPAVARERKVETSHTFSGSAITGTMTGSASNVTGGEPGACSAITGTGYNSVENYRNFCAPEAAKMASARTPVRHATPGAVLTGLQPGIGGKITGAGRGACEQLSGTPYVGADQFAQACETPAALVAVAPQPAAPRSQPAGNVTGTRYNQGEITGPFGLATGVITGTADFHSRRNTSAPISPQPVAPAPQPAASFEGRVKARISGEGMDSGLKITGDDWDRGDRVTGTEGRSAVQRNPTRRGQAPLMSAPAAPPEKRNEEMRMAVSKVTGGSGSTEKGSLITYSGGARG